MVYYGLLLFFVLEYIRPASYLPALNALHLNSIVPVTVLIGSMLTKRAKMSEVLGSPNARWLLFFMSLMVISVLTCDVTLNAFTKFEAVLGYFFMFLVVKNEIYDIDRVKGVLMTLILVHLIVGALNPELFSGDGERHYIATGSFLGDGNDFALSVTIAIPFCLFMLVESQGVTKKLFYAGALVILVIAVVSTQSRGGMIALACMGLYYWVKSDRKILGIVVIALMVVLIVAIAPPQFFDRMETMTQTGDEMEGSAQGRILAWGSAIRMAVDNPLLGVGVGHFAIKFGTEYRPEGVGQSAMPWLTAHSSYFLVLGELGIPGIVFLLGIILSNLMAGERMLREMKPRLTQRVATCRNFVIALNAGLIAFAVGGAFLSAAYYPHLYLLAALLECGRDLYKKSLQSETTAHRSDEDISPAYRGVSV